MAIKLTEEQKTYILNKFFKISQSTSYGIIGSKLLETGKCIVANNHRVWNGGIANFIEVSEYEGGYMCYEYKFNLEIFLKSDWFKENINNDILDVIKQKKEIDDKYESFAFLKNF